MPRPFTDVEAVAIRDHLLATATESFARRGVRGTTVDSLAAAAGISKGAFYRFFDSKEDLFLALVEQIETGTHERIEAAVRQDPVRGLDVLIDASLRAIRTNPLIEVAMSDEGLTMLRRMPAEQQEAFLRRDERLVEHIVGALHEAGITLTVPPSLLVGLLRSLVFLGLHRDHIGPPLADQVAAWLTPTLRAALVAERAGGGS